MNKRAHNYVNALDIASRANQLSIVACLLEAKANVTFDSLVPALDVHWLDMLKMLHRALSKTTDSARLVSLPETALLRAAARSESRSSAFNEYLIAHSSDPTELYPELATRYIQHDNVEMLEWLRIRYPTVIDLPSSFDLAIRSGAFSVYSRTVSRASAGS